jgi:hypothetical protein
VRPPSARAESGCTHWLLKGGAFVAQACSAIPWQRNWAIDAKVWGQSGHGMAPGGNATLCGFFPPAPLRLAPSVPVRVSTGAGWRAIERRRLAGRANIEAFKTL